MKHLIFISVLIVSTLSCRNSPSNQTSERELDPNIAFEEVYIGMTLPDLRSVFFDAQFHKVPVNNYGIDGESYGYLITENDQNLFFVWTKQKPMVIKGIILLSELIIIDENVHVGMTLGEFIRKYPISTIHIDMVNEEYEYINVPRISYQPEFFSMDSTRVARYNYENYEPVYEGVLNENARIDRISIK